MHTTATMKRILVDLGASWVLLALFAALVVAIGVYVERVVALRARSGSVRELMASLDAHLAKRDHAAAIESLRSRASTSADVARAGLRLASRGPKSATHAMESAIAASRKELESRLAILSTIGTNAPFVGLFGTVIGIVVAFDVLGHGRATGTAAAAVMGGISEALVATAVGIGVALPAIVMHNHLQRWVTSLLDDAETVSRLVVAYLVADEET